MRMTLTLGLSRLCMVSSVDDAASVVAWYRSATLAASPTNVASTRYPDPCFSVKIAGINADMFPTQRPRRLRHHPVLRDLVRETVLTVNDFILPLFVRPGKDVKKEIASMPGNFQLSVDRLVDEVGKARDLGVRAFILFGIPAHKDATGTSAWADDGIVQQALRAVRAAHKDVLLITDECFCE